MSYWDVGNGNFNNEAKPSCYYGINNVNSITREARVGNNDLSMFSLTL